MKVATVEEMRNLDQRAISEYGIPDHILMENAGAAVYHVILRELGIAGRRFAVVCGMGNNGGDGLVVARKIHSTGGTVDVFILGDPQRYGETSKIHYEMLARSGATITVEASAERVQAGLAACDAVIDGIFGTGITRVVGGRYRDVIERINEADRPVFAIDIPSGVDGNTGAVRGVAVRADWTVTFGLPKRGNLLYPGADQAGRLAVSHISFPPTLHAAPEITVWLNDPPPLPQRPVEGHKGSFGDVLFIAGAAGYYGAPAFAALSLLKAGGGYSRLATPRSVAPALAGLGGEIVFLPQDETASGSLAAGSFDRLVELGTGVDFVVLGPGLSLADETQELARRLAREIEKPLLIDGDGLTALAAEPTVLSKRREPTVLTPHPGEMSRLLGSPVSEILADPVEAARRAARQLNANVVLKGAHSLIAHPDGQVHINTSGNSGMASAGSGDVLTGTIAAMAGLGLPLQQAVRAGVFLHGMAGDLAADEKGEDGMTARDVLERLPFAVRAYRDDHPGVTANHYGAIEVI
jgi:NAD(P)H-hydrate epimerase